MPVYIVLKNVKSLINTLCVPGKMLVPCNKMETRMKKISTSTSSFEKLITTGKLYVDKTALLYELITRDKEYFCSRPAASARASR